MQRPLTLSHFAALAVLAALSGCATAFNQGAKPITIQTSPDSADISLDGHPIGVSPLDLHLDATKDHTIVASRAGYRDAVFQPTTHVQGGWVVLDVLFGLLPVVVDAATGNWKAFDQHTWLVQLRPFDATPGSATFERVPATGPLADVAIALLELDQSEAEHFAHHRRYTSALGELHLHRRDNVSVQLVDRGDSGFTAYGTTSQRTDVTCGVSGGTATAPHVHAGPDEVWCVRGQLP